MQHKPQSVLNIVILAKEHSFLKHKRYFRQDQFGCAVTVLADNFCLLLCFGYINSLRFWKDKKKTPSQTTANTLKLHGLAIPNKPSKYTFLIKPKIKFCLWTILFKSCSSFFSKTHILFWRSCKDCINKAVTLHTLPTDANSAISTTINAN